MLNLRSYVKILTLRNPCSPYTNFIVCWNIIRTTTQRLCLSNPVPNRYIVFHYPLTTNFYSVHFLFCRFPQFRAARSASLSHKHKSLAIHCRLQFSWIGIKIHSCKCNHWTCMLYVYNFVVCNNLIPEQWILLKNYSKWNKRICREWYSRT